MYDLDLLYNYNNKNDEITVISLLILQNQTKNYILNTHFSIQKIINYTYNY
jgi:hypothetical protein